jgi:putative transposase
MARKGFTPEQIINKLREAEILLSQGETVAARMPQSTVGVAGSLAEHRE